MLFGSRSARIAPQRVWPHTTTFCTPSTSTAYSTAAAVPPGSFGVGTTLPMLRTMKRSPGCVSVIRCGTTRETSAGSTEAAVPYESRGVVGFDIAGAEYDHPAKHHLQAFQLVRDNN